jgi:hypothetical protein
MQVLHNALESALPRRPVEKLLHHRRGAAARQQQQSMAGARPSVSAIRPRCLLRSRGAESPAMTLAIARGFQAQAGADPAQPCEDEINAEEKTKRVEARDRPVRQDHEA